jgi:hypothetical protein
MPAAGQGGAFAAPGLPFAAAMSGVPAPTPPLGVGAPGAFGGPFGVPNTNPGLLQGLTPSAGTPRPPGLVPNLSQQLDDGALRNGARAPRPLRADDDPFAHISVEVPDHDVGTNSTSGPKPAPGPGAATTAASLSTLAPSSAGAATSASLPSTATARPPRAATGLSATPLRRPSNVPSLAAQAGSWVALVASCCALVGGVAFAGWTSEALDLDAALLPTFETTFGVTPPFSFAGRDDVSLDDLRHSARAAEERGDLATAFVVLQQLRAELPDDDAARAGWLRVATKLGEPAQ